MEGTYEVMYGDFEAGKVQLQRQGLYLKIYARCRIPDKRVCRLVAQWQQGWENLGILIPEGEGMVLDRRLPSKRLPEGGALFRLIPSDQDITKTLEPEEKAPELEKGPALADTTEPAEITETEDIPEPMDIPDMVKISETEEQEPKEISQEEPGSEEEGVFIPIFTEEPFDPIDRLEEAVLAEKEGQLGALLPSRDTEEDIQVPLQP